MKMIQNLQRVFLIILQTFFVTITAQQNLALKGIARQKTTFTDAGGIVHSASLAVEGPANNEWTDGCSSTLPGQAQAWWGLFLPELAYITNVVFYFRGDDPEQTNEFRLYLSNSSEHDPDKSLCYTDLGVPGYPESTHDKNCNTLTRNVYFFNRNRVVVICYIEVNGCLKGTWGNNCTELCPSNCISNHCDIGNGNCVWGCDSRHCVHNRCDKHTGICTDGCVTGRAGQYCSKYNLASHGTATQYPLNPSKPASLSVDGNRTNGICSRTTGPGSYLQVDTGSLSVVTTVYLTFGDTPVTMGDNVLYCSNTSDSWVDGTVLYKGERPTKNIDVFTVCRYITYVPPAASGVDVCEFEIGGCPLGRYGVNCENYCHCNGPCDLVTGNCTSGCLDGWVGYKCDIDNLASHGTATQYPLNPNKPASLSVDGNRTNGICSRTTGQGSYLQVDTGSLSVVTTVYLTFGNTAVTTGDNVVYCSNTSDSWVDGIVLYKGERPTKNINVFTVCRYITYVPPAASGVDLCEFEIGGCSLGRYGVNCENYCHCNGPCDLVTGKCTSGCLDGWVGYKCDIACTSGNFGSGCSRSCSANCLNPPCNHVSGECTGGCNKGWEEYNCTKECDDGYFGTNCSQTCLGCISNKCDKINGECSNLSGCKPGYVKGQYCNQECEDKQFGIDCSKVCYCRTTPCNKFDGLCSDGGCEKGWHGKSCDKECVSGYFGFNCAYFCETCFNQSCDIYEGNCRVGCNDGYRGRKCETPVSAESSAIIRFGFFIGGLASMFVVQLIIWMVINARRRILKKQESRKTIDNSHSNSNEQHYDDIMKMESVSPYQDLTKQTVTVSSDYDQINNAYVNQ